MRKAQTQAAIKSAIEECKTILHSGETDKRAACEAVITSMLYGQAPNYAKKAVRDYLQQIALEKGFT